LSSRPLREASADGPLILAIDQGTSLCKVALCDAHGSLIAVARRAIHVRHERPFWADVDPDAWARAVWELVPQVLRESGADPSRIEAIGLGGLMHALVPTAADGNALVPAVLWMDQRCQSQCETLVAEHGDRIQALGAPLPRTTTSAAKLYALRQHDPAVVDATHKFLLPKDYLRLWLTGAWATDPSDAGGTALLTAGEEPTWAEEYVRDILDVCPSKLPDIQPSTSVAGGLTAQAASSLGLVAGTPVVTGASDVRCTTTGMGIHTPLRTCLYMGTAAWIARGPDAVGGPTRFLGATATFGAAMRWCAETICPAPNAEASYAEAERLAEIAPVGSDGLTFLPHMNGERGPYMEPSATGSYLGLTLAHGREHMCRAVYEGTACHIRHILDERAGPRVDNAELDALWCVGGGARSRLWLRILADIARRVVVLPREREAGLLGASLIAAVGVGRYDSVEEAADALVREDERITPRPGQGHDDLYTRYRALDDAMRPHYTGLPPMKAPLAQ
jgi:xylulokinase